MSKFIAVTNNTDTGIRIMPGLLNVNSSVIIDGVQNNFKISSSWQNMLIMLLPRTHLYPIEIKDWPSLKELCKNRICIASGDTDGEEYPEEEIKRATELAKQLEVAMSKYNKDLEKNQKFLEEEKQKRVIKLAEITK